MDITTANRLYELRKQHGYSQDELADKLNVSRQAISKWERSESSPDTDNLIALAKLYGVSLDELLNYTPAKPCEESKESQAQTQDENTDENAQSAVDDDKTTLHRSIMKKTETECISTKTVFTCMTKTARTS